MLITDKDIKFANCTTCDQDGKNFDALLIIIQRVIVTCFIVGKAMGDKAGLIYKDLGDQQFYAFLQSRGCTEKRFQSKEQIKAEIFPLIHEFLKDKPDDYFKQILIEYKKQLKATDSWRNYVPQSTAIN